MNLRLLSAAALLGAAIAVAAPAQVAEPGNPHDARDPVANVFSSLTAGTLHLRTGDVRTSDLLDVRTPAARLRQFDPQVQYVIQLDGPITAERRQALEAAGLTLTEYLPAYAYLVKTGAATPAALANIDFVLWMGEYRNEWKLDPEIGQRPFFTPERQAMQAQGLTGVIITLFPGRESRDTTAALANLGAQVHWSDALGVNLVVSATLPAANVAALAELADVQFVEEAWEITERNGRVRWVVQSNQLGVMPLYDQGLRGEGQVIGILDTRINKDHCSFFDSEPIGPTHRKILAYNETFGSASHGTHVAGTAAGDAGNDSDTRGVAYHAKIVYATWPAFTEQGILQRFNLHHSQGGRLHTNSWGDDGTTQYNGLCRGIDVFTWENEDSLSFWAVTNTNTMKNPENAKNLLAVGATQPPPNQHNHCTGGTGPTNDGRRKPEVYAPGCQTMSSQSSSSCGTASSSGTSMASPAVAGAAALVRQYFTDGYYPTGEPGSGEPFTPSGALVKSVVINSAVDMTGVAGYPSNQEGWGRILVNDSLYFLGDARKLFVSDVRNAEGLSTGMVAEETVQVLSSSEKLKVTLVWVDYPGAAGANPAYVNDLDLEVIGPGGTYKGNVFSGGVSVPGGVKDEKNNVEQVHIQNPGAGLWTIRVIGAAVNQGGTQGYALVVTGDIVVQEPPLIVTVPNGTPGFIDPGVPTTFDVRVAPGTENIVPGSEMLFYRYDGGSYNSVPLTHVGGEMYHATLPPADCDSTPEYYVQATGSEGTVRTSPANAPVGVFSSVVGHIAVSEIFYENFNGGLPGGWNATGLWHVGSSCPVSGACDGPQWAYYGQPATCNYETGGANSGNLTSVPIQLPSVPPGGNVIVSFCYNCQTEASQSYDKPTFTVNGQMEQLLTDSAGWTTFSLDITQFAGQQVTLNWNFDTVDGLYNNFRGWQVDAVTITAAGLACDDVEPACPADLNGSGSVDVQDLLILLGAWGPCQGCPADLNNSGAVDVQDLLILLGAWGPCPQ